MPNYRRAYTPGGTYFFTVVTYKRYPLFKNKSAIDLLQRCFQTVTSEYPFDIDAFVILPDHLHYIWTLPPNDSDFSTRWKRIKALFTRYYTGASALDVTPSMIRKGE